MGKKRLRDMTWDDYGISKNRYKELKAFCLQYDEKKSRIQYGTSKSPVVGEGVSSSGYAKESPVEKQAIQNSVYLRDIHMIEEAAVMANPEIWRHMLKSVTQDLPYEYVEYDEELGRIIVGRTDFYAYRKLFYHCLNEKKLGTN